MIPIHWHYSHLTVCSYITITCKWLGTHILLSCTDDLVPIHCCYIQTIWYHTLPSCADDLVSIHCCHVPMIWTNTFLLCTDDLLPYTAVMYNWLDTIHNYQVLMTWYLYIAVMYNWHGTIHHYHVLMTWCPYTTIIYIWLGIFRQLNWAHSIITL